MYKMFLMISMMISCCIYSMDTVRAGTGSACIVGGTALIIHGISQQTVFVTKRINFYLNPHHFYQPFRLEDWLREVAFPVVTGSTLFCTGLVLGWN